MFCSVVPGGSVVTSLSGKIASTATKAGINVGTKLTASLEKRSGGIIGNGIGSAVNMMQIKVSQHVRDDAKGAGSAPMSVKSIQLALILSPNRKTVLVGLSEWAQKLAEETANLHQ